jgi:hypothetical protein
VTTLERAYTAACMLPPSRERSAIIDNLVSEMRRRAAPRSELEASAVRHWRQVLRAYWEETKRDVERPLTKAFVGKSLDAHAGLLGRERLRVADAHAKADAAPPPRRGKPTEAPRRAA